MVFVPIVHRNKDLEFRDFKRPIIVIYFYPQPITLASLSIKVDKIFLRWCTKNVKEFLYSTLYLQCEGVLS